MGFLDTFKGNQYKNSMEALQKEYDSLKSNTMIYKRNMIL